ncbi:MAG TPA: FtsX-like permease family protein [Rectinemataceae bacterium]|nr:FtsX-like permease family protein [Rectinemataceae bacterium]
MTLYGLAVRNVFRNGRRTALNMIAIGLGVALMVVCLGWVQGYATYIYGAIIHFQTGSAQILREGYEDQSARFPLDLTVTGYRALRSQLLAQKGVTGVSGRLDFPARVIAPTGAVRLLGQGIDAESEREVSVLSKKIVAGSYLDGSPGILVGAAIARKLKVEVGAILQVSATDRYGVENRVALPLRGLFSFGYGAMDDSIAYLDLGSTQDLLDLGDEVTRVVLAGPLPTEVEQTARSYLRSHVGASAPADPAAKPLVAYGWQEFAKATVSGVHTDTYSFYVIAVILFALIIVGILNSMSMSVHERHRELAALRAIGFKRLTARRLILLEAATLAAVGTVAGFLVSAPIVYWLGIRGVDIAAYIPKDFPVPFGEIYHADYRLWHYVLSAALGVGASLAGALLPARRAARLPIAETIGAGI